MKRQKMEVKVLKGYDGFTAEIIETILRQPVRRGGYRFENHQKIWIEPWDEVSYKGKYYGVFILPGCYGKLRGACIAVKEF